MAAEPDNYFQHQAASFNTDLHDLVTSHLDTTTAAPLLSTSSSASARLLDGDASPPITSPAPSAALRPLSLALKRSSSQTLGNLPQSAIGAAEKAGDDPTTAPVRRFSLEQDQALSTPTRLNRLFAGPASTTSSREPSFRDGKEAKAYVRSMAIDPTSLNTHLYTRGLLGGRHSDIVVKVFGHAYPLHRIILDRAPFFSSALTEPWVEASSKEITLHPEDIDPGITRTTFELALKRLYGCQSQAEEEAEAPGLFATGCWLEMQDLVDASATAIMRLMNTRAIGETVQLVTNSYYGKPGEKILASAKAMLCRDGWSMPLSYWDSIPSDVIRELVGGDSFFIPGEWDRWVLARRILDRKLHSLAIEAGLLTPKRTEAPKALRRVAQRGVDTDPRAGDDSASEAPSDEPTLGDWQALYGHSDIEPLLELLDEGIHYMHLGFEHLQSIKSARDVLGVPFLPNSTVSNALWMNLELRQNILNAGEGDEELGLAHSLVDTDDVENEKLAWDISHLRAADANSRSFWIPSADCNIVVGGSGDPVVTAAGSSGQRSGTYNKLVQHADAVQWFSDFMKERSQASSLSTPDLRPASYSTFPPFRFAADFPNPRTLKERKRVYSQTVFYAGSYWNVYIQKVRTGTRNPQLGVYLHRARDREADIPELGMNSGLNTRGSVDDRIGALEREMLLRGNRRSRRYSDRSSTGFNAFTDAGQGHDAGEVETSGGSGPDLEVMSSMQQPTSIPTLSYPSGSPSPKHKERRRRGAGETTDGSAYNFISSPGHDDDESPVRSSPPHAQQAPTRQQAVPAIPPYADSRPTIKTYFKIYSPSKGGRMLSVYESAPDRFNFSQSWGWKSSTLLGDEGGLSASSVSPLGTRVGAVGTSALYPLDVEDGEMREGREFDDDYGLEDEERDKLPVEDGKLRFMVVLGVV
ncbi:hypothetical protein FH972_001632 [Carpinus fangiana]|uniref:BTB domain-containing protein n=1 Tax=Carpinus fangiana TaxID=176857 RepID=A0A5N6QCH7_9ROSI|nr:hypothetical protein FH972_001632 [Carpinus fangiana]